MRGDQAIRVLEGRDLGTDYQGTPSVLVMMLMAMLISIINSHCMGMGEERLCITSRRGTVRVTGWEEGGNIQKDSM